MTELIIAEEHSQLYELWLERGVRNLTVCHVDFHCDLRGLFIDRRSGQASFVGQHVPYIHQLDSGSYLSHAVMNGIVTKLRWVHDDFGGRQYDYMHCVKYETDLTALPHRLLGMNNCVPISFTEQTFSDWGGPLPGEHLDIDWDGIAFVDYDKDRIRRLMAEVLEHDFEPESIFVARSPGYCHPDQNLFEEFIAGLENKFNVQAVRKPFNQPA
ncbi:MAG: hypothetical protein PHR66_08675, partial [Desulfuromonadaceae bacterium]|nr:hypothetical protein [Desulfuromonadaceae bacterium]